jgi:hypothetical protein
MVQMLLNPLLHLRHGTVLLVTLPAILGRMFGLVAMLGVTRGSYSGHSVSKYSI